jgi:hypothetical protein
MSEKDEQNRGKSKKKHAPLTDFFRNGIVPNARLKQKERENQARLKEEWEAQENSWRKRWSIARLLRLDRPWFIPPVDTEAKFKEVLKLVQPDLPEEIYQECFDLVDRHNELEVAFVELCVWLEEANISITQDIFNRLKELGTWTSSDKRYWEGLEIHITK